jgi:HSP20 family protein
MFISCSISVIGQPSTPVARVVRAISQEAGGQAMADITPRHIHDQNASRPVPHRRRSPDLFGGLLDAFFDRFLTPWAGHAGSEFAPMRFWDSGMEENDKEIVVHAELPGFEPSDLDVQINNDVLMIRAEHQTKSDREQDYRSYRQSFTLPRGINPDKAEASYRNGVLELHIPKTEEARGRRIPIPGGKQGQTKTSREETGQAAQPKAK